MRTLDPEGTVRGHPAWRQGNEKPTEQHRWPPRRGEGKVCSSLLWNVTWRISRLEVSTKSAKCGHSLCEFLNEEEAELLPMTPSRPKWLQLNTHTLAAGTTDRLLPALESGGPRRWLAGGRLPVVSPCTCVLTGRERTLCPFLFLGEEPITLRGPTHVTLNPATSRRPHLHLPSTRDWGFNTDFRGTQPVCHGPVLPCGLSESPLFLKIF